MREYNLIEDCVKRSTGRGSVKSCWIAEVKRDLGLTKRVAWNRGKGKGAPPCPPELKAPIRECVLNHTHTV